jgi:hypothetical protein
MKSKIHEVKNKKYKMMNKKIIMIAIMACCAQVAVAQNNNTERRVADNPETQTPIQLDATPARTKIIAKKRTVPMLATRTEQAAPVKTTSKKVSDTDMKGSENESGARATNPVKKAEAVKATPRKSIKAEIESRRLPAPPSLKGTVKQQAPEKPMPKEKAVDW